MRNLFSLIIINTLFLINLTSAQLSGQYQIGPGGHFQSFGEAIDSLISLGVSNSIIFNVQTGTYREKLIIPEISGASSINTITFQSQAGVADSVVLWDTTTQAINYVVKLDSVDYITFRNMTFESHGETYARIFHLENHVENIKFLNNIFNSHFSGSASTNQSAIRAPDGPTYTTENLLISGNVFNNSGYGIDLSSRGWSIYYDSGTQIIGNTFNNVAVGISITGHEAPVIENNQIREISITGGGIRLNNCKGALRVLKNWIYFRSYRGISISSCQGSSSERGLIANNFIRNTGQSTSYLRGIELVGGSTYQDVFYNTVIFDNAGSYGVLEMNGHSTFRIMNNNLVCLDRCFAYDNNTGVTVSSDYNNIYNAYNSLAHWGVNCPNLDSLQTVSGQDLHSISVYPMFPDLDKPYTTHPWLDGAATPLSEISDDIDGNPRDPNNPDIGCCEFDSNPNSIPYAGNLTLGSGGDFTDFTAAIDSLMWRGINGPVTINVLPGDYQNQIKIRSIPGTSWQDTVLFQSQSGNPADVTLHHIPSSEEDNYTIYIYGADQICFDGLTLFSDTTSAAPFYRIVDFYGESENIHFRGNRFYGPPYHTVPISGYSYLIRSDNSYGTRRLISSNYFEGGSTWTVSLYGGGLAGIGISNNTFTRLRFAIQVEDIQTPVIYGNIMTQIFPISTIPKAVRLINCDGPLIFVKNQIYTSGGSCLEVRNSSGSASEPGLIANNFFRAGGGTGQKYGVTFRNATYQNLYYNSIDIIGSSTLTNGRCIFEQSGNSNLNIVNNILSNSCDGYTYHVNSGAALAVSDFNDLYTTGPNLVRWAGVNIPDLDSLRTISRKDLNSVSANPGFVSPSNLHATSADIDSMATPLINVLYDIDGQLRDVSYPDIGADEFNTSNNPPYLASTIPDIIYPEDSGEYLVVDNLNLIFSDPDPLDTLSFVTSSSNVHIDALVRNDSLFLHGDSNYFGMGSVIVTAIDTGFLSVDDTFDVTITNVNDPPMIVALPDSVQFTADTSALLDIWIYVDDPELADSLLHYLFEPTASALLTQYDSSDGSLTISSFANTSYSAKIYMTVTDDSGATAFDSIMAVVIGVTGIEDGWQNQIPKNFVLLQNYPNPFNPVTTIRFGLPRAARVQIELFNILGQRIDVIIDSELPAGYQEIRLNASQLGSGIYFYRMKAEAFVQTRKFMVVK
jgi:hypothetical protein